MGTRPIRVTRRSLLFAHWPTSALANVGCRHDDIQMCKARCVNASILSKTGDV